MLMHGNSQPVILFGPKYVYKLSTDYLYSVRYLEENVC